MYKCCLLLLIVALSACSPTKNKSMNAGQGGWISLLDGSTTNGWHTYGKKAAGKVWKVDNGILFFDVNLRKEMPAEGGDLITDEEFENYHLKLDWKISPKGNSGIIFNVHEDAAKYPNTYNTGPEMQVLDNGTMTSLGHPDAKLYTHRAGDLYDLVASKDLAHPAGEWNSVEIISNNGSLDFYMNGQHSLSAKMWDDNWRQMIAISKFKDMPGFGTHKKGRIALQDHGNDVWFRNIMIKKL